METFEEILHPTLSALDDSLLRHMPACGYRDYCRWALSARNPAREQWLRLMGISQLVRLTAELLRGTTDQGWEHLVQSTLPMNVYQIYEIITDNVAIGLATAPRDATHSLQRGVLLGFNSAMIQRLDGNRQAAADLLDSIREDAGRISAFEQSLSPARHRAAALAYLAQAAGVTLEDLERSLWPSLVANVEACAQLAARMDPRKVGPALRRSLINRYQGVSLLADDPSMTFSRMVRVGVDTILVEATLIYYVGVLAEEIYSYPQFGGAVADGTVTEALYHAAMALRLLNDAGTSLLARADEQRTAFVQVLEDTFARDRTACSRMAALLQASAGSAGPAMTRIHKDLVHGELNLVIHGLHDMHPQQGIPVLARRLAHLSRLYAETKDLLQAHLDSMSRHLGDDTIGKLIHRFVVFHENLYAHQYHEEAGEYAI